MTDIRKRFEEDLKKKEEIKKEIEGLIEELKGVKLLEDDEEVKKAMHYAKKYPNVKSVLDIIISFMGTCLEYLNKGEYHLYMVNMDSIINNLIMLYGYKGIDIETFKYYYNKITNLIFNSLEEIRKYYFREFVLTNPIDDLDNMLKIGKELSDK